MHNRCAYSHTLFCAKPPLACPVLLNPLEFLPQQLTFNQLCPHPLCVSRPRKPLKISLCSSYSTSFATMQIEIQNLARQKPVQRKQFPTDDCAVASQRNESCPSVCPFFVCASVEERGCFSCSDICSVAQASTQSLQVTDIGKQNKVCGHRDFLFSFENIKKKILYGKF